MLLSGIPNASLSVSKVISGKSWSRSYIAKNSLRPAGVAINVFIRSVRSLEIFLLIV